ncbi:MAG: hypothetical protein IPM17_15490 [Verrucomicrobia bacterium]|nr:hypothetical protein [Verrucomicrobiota bacterium]
MNRRQALKAVLAASAGASLWRSATALGQEAGSAGSAIYLHPSKGADTNPGSKESPLRTLVAAARQVNESKGTGAITIILAEGVYAVGETALFKPAGRTFTRDKRLTIRAEVLPDDADWHPGRMPTLIHTMPLSPDWNGRPDPFGGVAYGMLIETSCVTVQGLKILGMPVVEHPKSGVIQRVYPIGRNGRDLNDLEITQCLFAGDEVTNPNHLGVLANGSGIVVDHCIFYHLKQPIVYWSGGTKGHAMRHCLVYGAYGCGIWTSGIANDFEFRNNIVANSHYIWISQGTRSARAEAGPGGGGPNSDAREAVNYRVIDSLFTGNKKFTGSGGGPALNFRDTDPAFLELVGSKRADDPLELEMDQTKRNYLHPKEGSQAAQIGAGLFTMH